MLFSRRHFPGDQLRTVKDLHVLSPSIWMRLAPGSSSPVFGPLSDLEWDNGGRADLEATGLGDVRDAGGLLRFGIALRESYDAPRTVFSRDYGTSIPKPVRSSVISTDFTGNARAFVGDGIDAFYDSPSINQGLAVLMRHDGGDPLVRSTFERAPAARPLEDNRGSLGAPAERLTFYTSGTAYHRVAAGKGGAWVFGLLGQDGLPELGIFAPYDQTEDGIDVTSFDLPDPDLPAVAGMEEWERRWVFLEPLIVLASGKVLVQATLHRVLRIVANVDAGGAPQGYYYGTEVRTYRLELDEGGDVSTTMTGSMTVDQVTPAQPPAPGSSVGTAASVTWQGQGYYSLAAMETRDGLVRFDYGWNQVPPNNAPSMIIPLIDDDQAAEEPRPFLALASPYIGTQLALTNRAGVPQTFLNTPAIAYTGRSVVSHPLKVPPRVWKRLHP